MKEYFLPDYAREYLDEKSLKAFAYQLLSSDAEKKDFVSLLVDTCKIAPHAEECLDYLSQVDKMLFYRSVLNKTLQKHSRILEYEPEYEAFLNYQQQHPTASIYSYYEDEHIPHYISKSTFYRMMKLRELRVLDNEYIPFAYLTKDPDDAAYFFLAFVVSFCNGALFEYLSDLYSNLKYYYHEFNNGKHHPSRCPFNNLPSFFNILNDAGIPASANSSSIEKLIALWARYIR